MELFGKAGVALSVVLGVAVYGALNASSFISKSESKTGFVYGAAFGIILVFVVSHFVSQFFARRKLKKKEEDKRQKYLDDRRSKVFPNPFPHGWYKVADHNTLKPGEKKEIRAIGQVLLLFRGESGKYSVIDADCPHLGANLSDGKVVGDCVECPWHLWHWRGDGVCTRIPYEECVPSIAKTRAWTVREVNKMVLIWWHSSPDKLNAPDYEPALVEEVESNAFRFCGAYERPVKMHIQDFAENTADWQHFVPLHGNLRIPWTNIKIPNVIIQHKAEMVLRKGDGEDKEHQLLFKDIAYLKFGEKRIPKTDAMATTLFDGPGSITIFRFYVEGLGEPGKACIILFHTHLPLEPFLQLAEFRWYANPSVPKLLVSYIVGNWVNQWMQDVAIWEKKSFMKDPILVKNDGPIKAFRRWYTQFYPQQHIVLEHEKTNEDKTTRN